MQGGGPGHAHLKTQEYFDFQNATGTGVYVRQVNASLTGSLLGTSSWANNSTSASYSPDITSYTSSLFGTASWANNSISSSYPWFSTGSNIAYIGGNVGIGTGIPVGQLNVSNNGGSTLNIDGPGSSGAPGSTCGFINFRCDMSNNLPANQASIEGYRDIDNPHGGSSGGTLILKTVSAGAGSLSERIRLDRYGQIFLSGSVVVGTDLDGNYPGGRFVGPLTGSVFGTSSWANNATSASYALTSSHAHGIPTIKSGIVAGTSFGGNPQTSSITFGNPFIDNNYSITVTGENSRTWTIQSKVSGSFMINSNSNISFTENVFWQALTTGEFYS